MPGGVASARNEACLSGSAYRGNGNATAAADLGEDSRPFGLLVVSDDLENLQAVWLEISYRAIEMCVDGRFVNRLKSRADILYDGASPFGM